MLIDSHSSPGVSNTRSPKLRESPEHNVLIGKGADGVIVHTCWFHLPGVMSGLLQVLGAGQGRAAPVQLTVMLELPITTPVFHLSLSIATFPLALWFSVFVDHKSL